MVRACSTRSSGSRPGRAARRSRSAPLQVAMIRADGLGRKTGSPIVEAGRYDSSRPGSATGRGDSGQFVRRREHFPAGRSRPCDRDPRNLWPDSPASSHRQDSRGGGAGRRQGRRGDWVASSRHGPVRPVEVLARSVAGPPVGGKRELQGHRGPTSSNASVRLGSARGWSDSKGAKEPLGAGENPVTPALKRSEGRRPR